MFNENVSSRFPLDTDLYRTGQKVDRTNPMLIEPPLMLIGFETIDIKFTPNRLASCLYERLPNLYPNGDR